MARVKIEVEGYQCERCGHKWISRGENYPSVCPKCHSPYWDKPRKRKLPLKKSSNFSKK